MEAIVAELEPLQSVLVLIWRPSCPHSIRDRLLDSGHCCPLVAKLGAIVILVFITLFKVKILKITTLGYKMYFLVETWRFGETQRSNVMEEIFLICLSYNNGWTCISVFHTGIGWLCFSWFLESKVSVSIAPLTQTVVHHAGSHRHHAGFHPQQSQKVTHTGAHVGVLFRESPFIYINTGDFLKKSC